MIGTPLQQAIKCLKIRDVLVRKSHAFLAEDYEPKYDPNIDDLPVQLMHVVRLSRVLEIEDGEQRRQIFQVFIDLGARWVADEGGAEDQSEDSEPAVRAQIEATFVAEYELKDGLQKEAMDAFALNNASYHVWPYWREYLSGQCMRMGLPKIVVPTVQFAANHNQGDAKASDEE